MTPSTYRPSCWPPSVRICSTLSLGSGGGGGGGGGGCGGCSRGGSGGTSLSLMLTFLYTWPPSLCTLGARLLLSTADRLPLKSAATRFPPTVVATRLPDAVGSRAIEALLAVGHAGGLRLSRPLLAGCSYCPQTDKRHGSGPCPRSSSSCRAAGPTCLSSQVVVATARRRLAESCSRKTYQTCPQ